MSSIVGSIGVIAAGPRVPGLLERLGISVEEQRAGRLKGMGAPWRETTEEERAKEQALVDERLDPVLAHGCLAATSKLGNRGSREWPVLADQT